MSTIRNHIAVAAVIVALFPAGARAQTPSEFDQRSSVSILAIQTRPQGALARNIGFGYGLDGALQFRLDRAGILSLRFDLGAVEYGHESKRTALSETTGGRIQVDVRTTNYIMPLSFGPQITWPTGVLRPYMNAGLGAQGFFTESHIESLNDGAPFASTMNQSDITASWMLGGGVYVPIVTGKHNAQIDLGVQYLNGGKARYLAPGSIVDLPGGQVSISPMESATHLLVVHLGARIGF